MMTLLLTVLMMTLLMTALMFRLCCCWKLDGCVDDCDVLTFITVLMLTTVLMFMTVSMLMTVLVLWMDDWLTTIHQHQHSRGLKCPSRIRERSQTGWFPHQKRFVISNKTKIKHVLINWWLCWCWWLDDCVDETRRLGLWNLTRVKITHLRLGNRLDSHFVLSITLTQYPRH